MFKTVSYYYIFICLFQLALVPAWGSDSNFIKVPKVWEQELSYNQRAREIKQAVKDEVFNENKDWVDSEHLDEMLNSPEVEELVSEILDQEGYQRSF